MPNLIRNVPDIIIKWIFSYGKTLDLIGKTLFIIENAHDIIGKVHDIIIKWIFPYGKTLDLIEKTLFIIENVDDLIEKGIFL